MAINENGLVLKTVMVNPDDCVYIFGGGGVNVTAHDAGCLGEINTIDIKNNNPEAGRPPPITLEEVKKQIADFNSAVNRIFEERLPEKYSAEVLDPLKKALNLPLQAGKATESGIVAKEARSRFYDPYHEGYALDFSNVHVIIKAERLERFDSLPLDEGTLTPHETALLSLLLLLRKEKAE